MKKYLIPIIVLILFASALYSQPANCINPVSVASPFVKHGAGELCFTAPCMGTSINSWEMSRLEINGVDYTNRYADGVYNGGPWPAPVDGKYYIYYKGQFPWSHFEMNGTCSAQTSIPTASPTPTPRTTPTATPLIAPTVAPSAQPTQAPTAGPTPLIQPAPVWLSPATQSVSIGSAFTVEIHANTGSSVLGAFGFTVTYPSNLMVCTGIGEITEGINLVSNNNESGRVVLGGFSIAGIPGSPDLALIRLTFNALAVGTAQSGLTIQNLNDINGSIIGAPTGTGAMVVISGNVTEPPTAAPTEAPTAGPTEIPGTGLVWISPQDQSVVAGETAVFEIHANSGTHVLAAFGVWLQFDGSILYPQAVEEITDWDAIVYSANTSGALLITGFDASGIGPGIDIPIARIKLTTYSSSTGTSQIELTVRDLTDTTVNPIGNASGTGGSITVVAPTPEPTPSGIIGDVNKDGKVDVADGLLVIQYYVGLNPAGFDDQAGDVNGDGAISIVDGLLILQAASGQTPPQPTDPTPVPVPGAGAFTLTLDTPNVNVGDRARISAMLDTGEQLCAAYSLAISYPPAILAFISVTAGDTGFVSVVNAGTAGTIVASGFDVNGKGPGTIHLLAAEFSANGAGIAEITLTPNQLIDPYTSTIGTPSGASIQFAIEEAVPTDVPTSSPTTAPTIEPTVAPTFGPTNDPTATPADIPGAGNVWLDPASYTVNAGENFDTYVHVNTGDQLLGAYSFNISFDPDLLSVNTSLGNAGVDNDGSGVITAGTSTPGLVRVAGFDTYGRGPATDLPLATIHWIASSPGTSGLAMSVEVLVNLSYDTIGTPGATGGSVTVN